MTSVLRLNVCALLLLAGLASPAQDLVEYDWHEFALYSDGPAADVSQEISVYQREGLRMRT